MVESSGENMAQLEQSVLRYRFDDESQGLQIDTLFTTKGSSDGKSYISDIKVMDNFVLILESDTLPECPKQTITVSGIL